MRVFNVATRCVAVPFIVLAAACARQAEHVRIDGSPGVAPLMRALVEDYHGDTPRPLIDLGSGLGSAARIQALVDGRIDVAMASHGIERDDLQRRGLVAHEIARTAVVFAVNAGAPVNGITRRQACDVFGGAVTNWRELGGPDLPIAPRMRPATEVDAEVAIAGVPCLAGLRYGQSVRLIERPDEMAAELSATPGAIGVTSMTMVEQSGGRMRALALDGVAPSAENVGRDLYTLTRRSVLVTRSPLPPGVARLLDYIGSQAGARVIRANGAVPMR